VQRENFYDLKIFFQFSTQIRNEKPRAHSEKSKEKQVCLLKGGRFQGLRDGIVVWLCLMGMAASWRVSRVEMHKLDHQVDWTARWTTRQWSGKQKFSLMQPDVEWSFECWSIKLDENMNQSWIMFWDIDGIKSRLFIDQFGWVLMPNWGGFSRDLWIDLILVWFMNDEMKLISRL
jgi:hypothetical protein